MKVAKFFFFRVTLIVLNLVGFTIGSVQAQSQAPAVDDTLAHQRNVFKALENMLAKPNSDEYKRLRAQLQGYPLEPYIEQITLKTYPYLANQDKIDAFLRTHEGSPLDRPLRYKWLTYLKKKNQADLFMQYFRPTANVELTCQYLTYQMADPKNHDEVFKHASELWVVGKSQPNECDPVFDAWTKAGFRTNERVLKRLALAGNGGSHTLLPYLKTLLPKEQQYLADLWLQVRRAPNYVSNLSKFPKKYPELELEIIEYGLGRLIWRDEDLAIKTWQATLKKFDVAQSNQYELAGKFAVALAISEHKNADEWLEKASYEKADEQLYRWHLAHVLKSGDWQHALEVIEQMPEKSSSGLSAKYWQARALEKVNAMDSANQNYQWLAQQRHYYGFLASGKLAQPPTIVDKPLEFDQQALSTIANMDAAKRAYEFLQLGRYLSARREWLHLQSQLDQQQKLVSAVLADSWGWHDRAIYGFSNTGYLDDIKRRFPMAYRNELVNHSEANQVDPAWAFAIARRESSFMADANSSAGAKGLMQLLPGTARYLAKKQIKTSVLFDPDTNAGYGTQYLRYLMDKMDNNPVLATASYNAGWRRVQKWIPKDQSVPMDVWIETIPYKETRNYVKAVLAYHQIYAAQLGKNSPLFNELATMQLGGQTL
ncbi:lytic transglycosylase domain-containing protein [Aliiglaciecola lipolytica]|uniref:lytic transglycosylase domain-containing protein n=1 Tax=Aliiglaciecola lipolytica TaxID=477689 RepID=UPI00129C8366|nr:lytic transglycosylase domain-containing protein [Aliiglaciecola lipolytica]